MIMENGLKKYGEIRERYISLFGEEPSSADDLEKLEKSLRVTLPDAFKEVAKFYRGGMIGGISHHSMVASGPANNILEETQRIQKTTQLPRTFIVLAEPSASLIVLNTQTGSVLWLDSTDIDNLNHPELLHDPQTWTSYADFFSFLLKEEEEERA
jgi:hypothetical protein